jgi:hypothetical protein
MGIRRTSRSATAGTRPPICGNVSIICSAWRASCAKRSATRKSRSRYHSVAFSSSVSAGFVIFSGFNGVAHHFRCDRVPYANRCSRAHRRGKRQRVAGSLLPKPFPRRLRRPEGCRAIPQRSSLARREEVRELRSKDRGLLASSSRIVARYVRSHRNPSSSGGLAGQTFACSLLPKAAIAAGFTFVAGRRGRAVPDDGRRRTCA